MMYFYVILLKCQVHKVSKNILLSIRLIKREAKKSTEPIGNNIECTALEKQIEAQNKKYYEVFDQLAEHLSQEERIEILDANCQFLPKDEIEVSTIVRFVSIRSGNNDDLFFEDINKLSEYFSSGYL